MTHCHKTNLKYRFFYHISNLGTLKFDIENYYVHNKKFKEDDEIIPKLERIANKQETIHRKLSIFESWFK